MSPHLFVKQSTLVERGGGSRSQSLVLLETSSYRNAIVPMPDRPDDKSATTEATEADSLTSRDSSAGFVGVPANRPSRENVLRRLSEALLRRSLAKVRVVRCCVHNADITDATLQIDLSQRGLRPSDARLVKMALMKNASLTVLKLGYNNLGDSGVAVLAAGLLQHRALTSLDLGFNNIGDEGCRSLAGSLTPSGTLRTLYLAGNLIGEDGALAIADAIRRGVGIERLYLAGNSLGPDGVKGIVDAALEHELNIREARRTNGRSARIKPPVLEELHLGGTGIGSVGCAAITSYVSQSSHLRVLSLPNCEITDSGMARLATSIKANRENIPLEVLQLSFNRITCKGMEIISNAVWGLESLRELLVDNNDVGDRGAQHIATVIPSLKRLEKLDVGFNKIQSLGMKLLMKSVSESTSLHSVSVSGNAIDIVSAKAIAYALAYNKSLDAFALVNCSPGVEGQRHIVAGIVSNRRLALRNLSGFPVGPVVVTLGFPPELERWTNSQVLHFVQIMWQVSREDDDSKDDSVDPLHFLPSNPAESADRASPLDAAIIVDMAKKAYSTLVAEGSDGIPSFLRSRGELAVASPIAGDKIVDELPAEYSSDDSKDPDLGLFSTPADHARSFVAVPEAPKEELPDPARKKRIVEWLCANVQQLNTLSSLPFSSGEMWKLHQHYFTPVVNESGGPIADCGASSNQHAICMSVPEVSRPNQCVHSADDFHSSTDCADVIPSSEPVINDPSDKMGSLSLMKRKVSYRCLGDAAFAEPRREIAPRATTLTPVSMMIETGPSGQSLPRKHKRARRNRSRISFLPRIKAKLDSYLDANHEKALAIMRQLYFVERAILSGQVNPLEGESANKTHLCGALAADAEMIVTDML